MNTDQYVAIMDDYTSLRQRMLDGISELAEYFPKVKHVILLFVEEVGFLTVSNISYVKHAEGLNIIFEDIDGNFYMLGDDIQLYEISTDDLLSVLKSLIDTKNRQ